jgi:hypothetical protein
MDFITDYNDARRENGFPEVTVEEYYDKFPSKRPGALEAQLERDAESLVNDPEVLETINNWKNTTEEIDPNTGLKYGDERVVIDGEEYVLNLGQLNGYEPLPPEVLFKQYQSLGSDGQLSPYNRWHDSSLIRMGMENPEMFEEQFSYAKSPSQLSELEDRFHDLMERTNDSSAYDLFQGFIDRKRNRLSEMQGQTDRYYVDPMSESFGEELPYVSPITNYQGKLTINNPQSSAFPQHMQKNPHPDSGWEPSGWSNPMDIRTAKAALEEFGPAPTQQPQQPQQPMTFSQFDEMNQSPEQKPMEFDQIGYDVERGGQQPQQFNPADVTYGNGGEPAPKRSREENEWGYFYE